MSHYGNLWLQLAVACTSVGLRNAVPRLRPCFLVVTCSIVVLAMLTSTDALYAGAATLFVQADAALLVCALTMPDFNGWQLGATQEVRIPLVRFLPVGSAARLPSSHPLTLVLLWFGSVAGYYYLICGFLITYTLGGHY
ncbi:hypothetical protein [Nocardia sp. NPDC052566]|uniref:hypothetical protein n=1 Tax=Nocardia sp. NPDC052566 TaxID=3364330 RepID=UPI0037CC18ED